MAETRVKLVYIGFYYPESNNFFRRPKPTFGHKTILLNSFHPTRLKPTFFYYLVFTQWHRLVSQINITHSHLCVHPTTPGSPLVWTNIAYSQMLECHSHTKSFFMQITCLIDFFFFLFFCVCFEKFHLYRFAYKSVVIRNETEELLFIFIFAGTSSGSVRNWFSMELFMQNPHWLECFVINFSTMKLSDVLWCFQLTSLMMLQHSSNELLECFHICIESERVKKYEEYLFLCCHQAYLIFFSFFLFYFSTFFWCFHFSFIES